MWTASYLKIRPAFALRCWLLLEFPHEDASHAPLKSSSPLLQRTVQDLGQLQLPVFVSFWRISASLIAKSAIGCRIFGAVTELSKDGQRIKVNSHLLRPVALCWRRKPTAWTAAFEDFDLLTWFWMVLSIGKRWMVRHPEMKVISFIP
jgi:hypothetical protein